MKKITFFYVFFMFGVLVFGQAPAYYNDVNLNLTGQSLKDELAVKIINTHSNFLTYTPEVWDALKLSDLDPNDANKVILIYGYDDTDGVFKTDRTRNKDDNGGAVGLWNREHVYPKSLGNPDLGTTGPGSDAHHLRPSDGQMNSSRSNRMFADGSGNSVITPQGHWYPGDEFKGDVARMMMYMYLRYGSVCLPSNVGVGNAVAGDANMIDLFLQWNVDDPVNGFEDNRNEVLAGIQGNRNPFIDNPAFATQIWGGPQAEDRFGTGNGDTEVPSVPANLVSSNITSNATILSWTASTDNVGVTGYDVYQDGVLVGSTALTTYNVSGLNSDTLYSFYVVAKDQAGNMSANSNTVSVMTLPSGGGSNASDLFISEYIEGSSNNKALEVANFTGATVDLSSYSLKKATNGSGSFSSTLSLSGQLADGQVYVIANSSATTVILNEADVTNAGVMTFNGNDAVGLFKNDVLIDKLGDENSSSNYAQNTTLRRKSSILSPNVVYTTSEWDSYATDTFDGLGVHTIDGGTTPDTEAPSIPTSLIASNLTQTTLDLLWNASTDNIGVTGYDVSQDGIVIASVASTNFAVTGLADDTNYSFSVRAKDEAGNVSVFSASINITTLPIPDTTAPTVPGSVVATNVTETDLDLSWTASTDNVGVTGYDVYQDGVLVGSTALTSYNVSGLNSDTLYSFYVVAKDQAGNMSANSNTVSVMTLPSGGGSNASDLFISEYIEGSSNNKALEVANFTGATVDLSSYSLKKATNGSGSFSSTLSLSGQLADGQVYVIANSSATTVILNEADVTNAGVMTFNGNDAVGLFKNDVLIDKLGDENSSSNYAQNTTLRRKSSILSPNVVYTTSEWDSYATDTFDGLGVHTIDGATDTTPPTIPTSLVASAITETTLELNWTASTDDVAVDAYDVYQDGLLIASTTVTNYSVTGLNSDTTYSFVVQARDAAGNVSGDSNTETVTTDSPAPTVTVLSESYFESGWDGWTDGGSDCYRYYGSRSYEGNRSIRLRDNSGTSSAMTSSSYNLSAYDSVEVSFYFYSYSMENNEDFWLRFYDGGSWNTVATWARGTDFSNNNFYTATVTIDSANYNFASNSQFRFQADASGNGDHIYIDQVVISGITGGSSARSIVDEDKDAITFVRHLNTDEFEVFEEDFKMFPNPVAGKVLNIQLANEDSEKVTYRIVSMLGQVVHKGELMKDYIEVDGLQSGIYILEINDGEEVMTRRFVKK